MLFLETGSPAKSLSTKTVILSTCFCLRNLSAALGFPTRYRAARFNGINSNSRGSLILWAKRFVVSARSNLSWARYESFIQADLYRVASHFFIIGLRLPSCTSLSCSVPRGVLNASVFVLHPGSLMMSGACLRPGSISRYCPVWSTPTLNTRFNNRRLFTSESSNPSVPMFFAVYLVFRRLSKCLNPSSSDKHTESSPCTAILTSWIRLWHNAALCLPLKNLPTLHRLGSRSQAARCGKHPKFHTCSWSFCQLLSSPCVSSARRRT